VSFDIRKKESVEVGLEGQNTRLCVSAQQPRRNTIKIDVSFDTSPLLKAVCVKSVQHNPFFLAPKGKVSEGCIIRQLGITENAN
jgi:hypothetical protein